jgi:flavin-dependent dehydrogenase
MDSSDVFVIGGGPAGLAAAIAARQRGLSVLVADGSEPPIDKACGEGLLPDGLEALEGLGVQVPAPESRPFSGIRFVAGSRSADAPFAAHGVGRAIRRPTLHSALVERAEQLGVGLLWRTVVTGISGSSVTLGNRNVHVRWIVGADGFNSRVRRWAGLDRGRRPRLRYAFRQHFRIAPWSDRMEVYWGERCQGYATAVSNDQVCVALASRDPQLRIEQGLAALPELGARLRGAEVVSAERGALTGNRTFHRVWRGNVALIGDASGTVDAITGEGLGLSFRQAVVLAECLERGDLRPYQAEHRRLARRPLAMARLMLTLDRRPGLQKRAVQVFNRHPEVFQRLLELHIGARSPVSLARDGLILGWGLLTT